MARTTPSAGEIEGLIAKLKVAVSALENVAQSNIVNKAAAPLHMSQLTRYVRQIEHYAVKAMSDTAVHFRELQVHSRSRWDQSIRHWELRTRGADVPPPAAKKNPRKKKP